MSRKNNAAEKSPKFPAITNNRTDVKRPNEEFKQKKGQSNINSNRALDQTAKQFIKNTNNRRLSNKEALPPISTARSNHYDDYNNTDNNEQDFESIDENSLPLKLFDGKKQSLNELSEESMSYLWLRRIKELFLHMGDGNDEQEDDPFVEFDMNLAKTDLTNICDRYIENELLALAKKDSTATTTTKAVQKTGSLQDIQDSPKETTEKRKEKSELEKKQEWDMKKLYVEVFKMSYKRNRLITQEELEDLTPKKKGDYQPNFRNAIWWYSCDKANIYYQINSILRLENFELLMSYRYYLSDLCRMIEFMYKKRKEEYGDVQQKFYRAGNVSKKQLEKMRKQQKGQVISLVGFISTTTDIEIAKGYARKQNISKDNERVLFQINIKPQEPCTAFAYIDGISFHPEEKEVLFSMGSTFTVDAVEDPKNGDNYHTIQLTASEIDKSLIDDIHTKIENCSPSGRAVLLAQYLMELGEYRAARKYLNSLLTQACDGGVLINDPSLAIIYCCLGMTYARQGLHGDAIKAFKQALNTQARLEYSNNNVLANIHNNIGLAYVGLGHMDEAKETLSEAVRIQLREPKSNQQHLATIYSNIGYVHYKKGNYKDAKDAFNEAEKIYKRSSSKIAHDALEQSLIKADYLTNYGHLLIVDKSLDDAQERYNEALKLYKNILPDNDPKLMQTHINIMLAYAQNENDSKVTKWYEDLTKEKLIEKQEINMFELNSSVTQASLAFLHEFVGACYVKQKLYDKAIDLWARALIFKHKARLEQLLLETTNSISSTLIAEQKDLIKNGYLLARKYYTNSDDKTNKSTDDTTKQLPKDFCLGLLYAESYSRDEAIKYLTKAMPNLDQSNNDILLVTYLLSADMLKHRHKYNEAINCYNNALDLIKSLKIQNDRVLEIEIKLARSDCLIHDNPDNAIAQLQELGRSLKLNDTDTKRISLQVIVYDTLAQYCLKQKEYELFDEIAKESMSLKLRSFSQYHPCLAINLILIAERHTYENHYREALDFYEHALEIQTLNLTDNHPKIKKICYAIGDIYCKLDKLTNAKEKYDVAENKSSNLVEDDVLQQDKINSEEATEILKAQISMHRHLAEFHERKQGYKEAILEMNEILSLLEKELPPSTFEMSDETVPIQQNIDEQTLINRLQQLANCYLYLGDILGFGQEDDNGYQAALNIYLTLYQYDEELIKNKLVLLHKKLSNYYEDIGDNEKALEFLEENVDLEEPTIDTLYRLGFLNAACDEFDVAVKSYKVILSDESIKEDKQLKQIVQEKLDEVQKKAKEQQRRRSSTSSESDKSITNNEMPGSINQLSRKASNISIVSHNKNEENPDTNVENAAGLSDPRAKAVAYMKLGDLDKSIKSYEKDIKERTKDIKERTKNMLDSNIFANQLKEIEQATFMYEQQNVLIFLPELFHSLIKNIRKMDTFEVSDILVLADSYFQCALLYEKSSSHLKSLVAFMSAFGLYVSKSTSEVDKLIGDVNNLLNSFIDCDLKAEKIIEIYEHYLPPDEIIKIRLKIATMYRDDRIDYVEDTDGDGDTSNEARIMAIDQYKKLLHTTKDVLMKGVCYYNILSLYKDFIREDESGNSIVKNMIGRLPEFTNSDRRLLIPLAFNFLKEYDNINDSCNKTINDQLRKIAKETSGEKWKVDDESSIGHYLITSNDLIRAEDYWNSIANQLKNDIPNELLALVLDPHSTFDQILRTIEQPVGDTTGLFDALTNAYEKIGDYYMSDATAGQRTDIESFRQAESMYKKAAHLLKRLKADTNTINKVEKKRQEAESQANK